MTLHSSEAIVLKRDRSGESSLLVELFLKDQGRLSLLAKGARRPDSVMVGKLEPFSQVEVLYYQKSDENLGIISQVNQLRTNLELISDIRRLSYASAVVEALQNLIYSGQEQEKMYSLVAATLYMLNYAPSKKLEFYFLVFLIKALDLIGIAPQLEYCIKSGKQIVQDEILFSVEEGGIIAEGEASAEGRYFKLDRGILTAIKKVRETDIDKLKGLNFTEKQKEVIKDLLFSFLSFHTDSKPSFKSLNFLSKLASY